jgi:Na+-driven multidrug efflux pump
VGGLIANVGINLVLIPIYGPLGAAWANLISQAMIAGILVTPWMLLPNDPGVSPSGATRSIIDEAQA